MAKTKFNTNQINLGDESSIDLLNTMNTAKVDLANNLNGKGISADADTETLQGLIDKVPNILSDSNQNFQECLTMNIKNAYSLYDSRTRINVNGYVIYAKATKYLTYAKISEISQSLINVNVSVNVANLFHTSESLTDNINNDSVICVNENATKIYVWCNNVGSRKILGFDINWSGDNITSITVDSNISYSIGYPFPSSTDVDYIGCLVCRNNHLMYNSRTGVFILDLTNGTLTKILNGNYGSTSGWDLQWFKDDEFILANITSGSSSYAKIEHYSLDSFSSATLLQITQSPTFERTNVNSTSSFYKYSNKIEYDTNKFKIFFSINGDKFYRQFCGCVYDTYNKTITLLKGFICNYIHSDGASDMSPVEIGYFSNINKYIIFINNVFFIYDNNFNFINSINVNVEIIQIGQLRDMLFTDNKIISLGSTNSESIQYFYGKKTLVKKTKSINGESKDMFFAPFKIDVTDIENGYYD